MSLPQLTHLQYLVLSLVRPDAHSGRFIRQRIADEGVKKDGPTFYQLMARLERDKLIAGWYESFSVDGQTIKERRYELTPKGRRALEELEAFYGSRRKSFSVESGMSAED
jgi:DNA-binding PadR family transcriptional regulator